MTHLRRHLREWLACVRAGDFPLTGRIWLKMFRGLVQRPVQRSVFLERARICLRCPIYDRELRRCAGPYVRNAAGIPVPTGCGCYLPFMLRMPAPYKEGCWARHAGLELGWPAFTRA